MSPWWLLLELLSWILILKRPRIPGGAFQKCVRAMKISMLYNKLYLSMYGWDILCGISKGAFESPLKISDPHIKRCGFLSQVNILELLDLRVHRWFWNTPLIITPAMAGSQHALFQKMINSLAPGRCANDIRSMIFKFISMLDILSITCKTSLMWMSQDLTDDYSILVQVMAWCCQAPSHYLSQCWRRFMSLNGVLRPQLVNRYHD